MNADALGYMAAGAALGLGAGMTPGPLLTLVLSQTLSHGFKEGAKVAFAPLLTDLPILLMSILAMSWMKAHPSMMGVISIVGAIVVALFGYDCFKTRAINLPGMNIKPGSLKKGVLANYMNPHVYIFWATVGAPTVLASSDSGMLAPILFLLGFYVCIIGSKISVAYLAGKFRSLLSSRTYLIIMRVLGLALFTFALFLLRDGLRFLGFIN
ncbi:LysE family transporter [Maridesulfovibrio frigidus]|uniref:LysE family transporter n=1 Tax=Maridesulfovibrio frigidus TaxID=340956 RepID=UPI0004E280C5|nr:LysE family transporter [Maridesulfovibrio frigidus]